MATPLDTKRQIHRAVEEIAARCDGAQDLDGVGFSGVHAQFGKQAASIPPEAWTDELASAAYDMLRTYRGQLHEYGVDYDALPKPEKAAGARASKKTIRAVVVNGRKATVTFGYDEDLVASVHRLPGARWNAQAKHWDVSATVELRQWAEAHGFAVAGHLPRVTPPAQQGDTTPSSAREALGVQMPPRGRVSLQGSKLVIRFNNYYPDLVRRVKGLADWSFDRATSSWEFPKDMVKAVRRLAAEAELDIDDKVLELAAAPDVTVRIEGMRMVVKSRFDSRLSARMGQLGAQWRGDWRAWVLPISMVEKLIVALDELKLEHDLDVERALAYVGRLHDNLAASKAEDAELPEIPGLAIDLFPFQRAGVAYAARNRRCFIADQVGLGKTFQALAALEAMDAFPAVIVVPAAVKLNWLREARRALPRRNGMILAGEKPRPFGLLRPDFVVINYDILVFWMDVLVKDLRYRALVLDESHNCKEPTAQRTQAAVELGAAVPRGNEGAVLLLSGTPVLNRRVEYASQLEVMGRLEEFGGRKAVQNDGDISEHLRSAGAMVRRLKKDVQDELPPVMWQHLPLEPDPKVMVAYQAAEEDLLKYLAERAYATAAEQGHSDPTAAAVKARMRAASAEHLVRIGVLKQLAARAKLPAAKRWVQNELDGGDKMLLFAHHVAILDSIEDRFGCASIRGGQTPGRRQAIVDTFQEGEENLLALGLNAGGVGITLTAAQSVTFLEQGWTPAIHDQAVGRCWGRLNDCHGARATVLYVEGTIDEWIAALIGEKRIEVDNATDGVDPDDTSDTGSTSIVGGLLDSLTDLALTGGSVAQAAGAAMADFERKLGARQRASV